MAIDDQTKKYILTLYFPENPEDRISVKKIIEKLDEENEARAEGKKHLIKRTWKVPCQRTIYHWIKEAKGRISEGMGDNDKPWSMLLSDKAGIPFDRVLIRLLRFWFERQLRRGQGPPFVPFSIGVAKWAVRLHKIAPFLVEEGEQQLLYRARQYFNMERIDILTGKSSGSIYEDLEIAMKDSDTNPDLRADYDQFYGVKKLVPQVKEVQTENGKIFEIGVPPDIAEKMAKNSTRDKGKTQTPWL